MADIAKIWDLLFIHDLNTFWPGNINDHNPEGSDRGVVKSQCIKSSFACNKLCYLGQMTYEFSAIGVFFFVK